MMEEHKHRERWRRNLQTKFKDSLVGKTLNNNNNVFVPRNYVYPKDNLLHIGVHKRNLVKAIE